MARTIGTQVRGVRAPIVKEGDNIVDVVVNSIMNSTKEEGYSLKDMDVIGVTESLVARAQGNYVTVDQIAFDISNKFKGDIGLVFPILSRNRFSIILKAIAKSGRKIHLLLSYPADEVGNHLMDIDKMDELNIDPYKDVLTESDYRRLFGEEVKHKFTGIDYIKMYKSLGVNDNISVYLANDPRVILKYTKEVLVADIHTRQRTKRLLKNAGAEVVYGLDDICTVSIDGSGYNPNYGLLGSNKSTEEKVKLFPRDCQPVVDKIQRKLKALTGKNVEVMIYGDGAFKDPVGKIWELADPVVSPGFTSGLHGTPNELKLKYLADNDLKDLNGEKAIEAMRKKIKNKSSNLVGTMETQGTTPRQLTDLLGSLCDLTSGSGDKGTPIVLVQGYFDNYATE
ncbi:F420-0:Gamma-glutamyl ligase [Clostridium liquoris]|uniref:F420-0:Gamma-glutamyl ligase n=1 Tax=Clostridium liquoris TaxID=1289519 RepID=A0A2T0B2E2_9CLOT|nr:coenzyme F420-0:L-glutamate ligase [Clostridium liquoris]PRR78071.1 F420-0:Gamma-glutamyl ligase [Clostridium liquoris]